MELRQLDLFLVILRPNAFIENGKKEFSEQ